MATEPAEIVYVVFPGLQVLDLTGPHDVLARANLIAGAPVYRSTVAARTAGPVTASSGLTIVAEEALADIDRDIDTLMVVGGHGTPEALGDRTLVDDVRRLAARARRVTAVCSGAFLLAEAGLLDGRRATTHWQVWEHLAAMYPAIDVDPDPIHVKDGNVYTSAGVTAGMDLALALVEEDHGRELALAIARALVLFLKRPANQSQFSAHLAAQTAERDVLREVQTFITEHPEADLSVPALARRAAMSERHFARCFTAEVGLTPARYVERVRVETARRLLEETSDGVESIALRCGFGTPETMRRTFLRLLRTSPTEYRRRFRAA